MKTPKVCSGCKRASKENARLRKAIKEFCDSHSWAVEGWKQQPNIKALFDIAKEEAP